MNDSKHIRIGSGSAADVFVDEYFLKFALTRACLVLRSKIDNNRGFLSVCSSPSVCARECEVIDKDCQALVILESILAGI